ncbi:MAG TPA: hypothetical protein VHE34_03315 [Puia sp.]|uniref:hypothetical protein n=1 Tax=Puia sp. TaxID=2045100 RepID=UPI002C8012DD|nr:hypothetical protein [Puia sp.]HVU94221.1 hypothetical protein [Puia sp.]
MILTLITYHPVPAQSHTGFEQYYCPGSSLAAAPVTRVWYATAGKSYIEARYNYDAEENIGLSAGKQFGGTNAKGWYWTVTPTAGIVTGSCQGFSLGANLGLRYKNWNFSSAAQFTPAKGEGYACSWSELGRPLGNNAYLGAALQQDCRTGSGCTLSPGLTAQLSVAGWTVPLYVFNPFDKRVLLLMGVTREWVLQKSNANQKNAP